MISKDPIFPRLLKSLSAGLTVKDCDSVVSVCRDCGVTVFRAVIFVLAVVTALAASCDVMKPAVVYNKMAGRHGWTQSHILPLFM